MIDKNLKQALTLQEDGKLDEAGVLFSEILAMKPNDVVALYSLGVIAVQSAAPTKALEYFDRAAQLNPNFAPTWYNRGVVLATLGKRQEALQSYDRALQIDPQYREALGNRAALLQQAAGAQPPGQLEEMAQRALELQHKGDLQGAEGLFRQILEVKPWDFVSLYSMGVLSQQQGNPSKALEFFEITAKGNPGYAPIWYNRGTVLQSLKRLDEALENYDHALKLDPSYREARVNRGAVLQEMNRHTEALENYDKLLEIDPTNDKALGNKGILLTEFKRYDEASATFAKLLEINPDYDYGLGLLAFSKMHACDWDGLEEMAAGIEAGVREDKGVTKTMALLAISDSSADHLRCSRIFARSMYPAQQPMWRGERYRHDKIRVAYVSPDFREHPVGHLTAGIFENHDRSRFETVAISLGIDDRSALRSRISAAFDRFVDARMMNTHDIAKLMREMEVDIAIDLAGYTADSRTGIFAYRPAPVQVNYLGYPSTLGVDYLDYVIADRFIIPEYDRQHFSEKVVYLPHTYLPTDSGLQVAERTPAREEFGLPAEGFVFCSFNHAYKINPAIFGVWMEIMKDVPGSVLWLMKLNASAEGNLRREAQTRGVDPERLIFATRVPRVEDHLARYRLADLFLDTTPYNAHTTASDALFVGLPVLTYFGKAFPGRVAAGLVNAIGCPDLVTESLEEYRQVAVELAHDPERVRELKERLARNRHTTPLFDTVQFCRYLESAYQTMWRRHEDGLAPESFAV